MTLSEGDLRAYFDRIGFTGEPRADRATLAAIVEAHASSIPFENLSPLLGVPVELSSTALMDKLVRQRRGGYCFEQNGLLVAVLATLGFDITPLAARVLWNQSEDALTARTHMLLLVELCDGPVIADVGFGGAVCTGVLDLVADVAQETPHERFRFIRADGDWRQQIEIEGEWRTTYRFDLSPQLPIDYELANWWTSSNPKSHFTFSLAAALSPNGRRLALRNFDYAVHVPGAATERRTLRSPEEVCSVLEQAFGIHIPDRAALLTRLEALA
ncbi:MAG: arylamine N-acetyltransferase family protein [Sphingomicrobium sp.]